jgi:N-acetylglucosamine-6-phosphate deacetylase
MDRMSGLLAFVGGRLFDGARLHADRALVIDGDWVIGVVPHAEAPRDRLDLAGALLAPGFVDWQVNGGGGVLFNDAPTPEGVLAIAQAHARFGVTAMTPTLITDRPGVTRAAGAAVAEALRRGSPGVVGVHFEGPHLAAARKGAHDAGLFRPMTAEDAAFLAAPGMGRVIATVAPEIVAPEEIRRLVRAGVRVSLGHSDASFETATGAFDAGACATTHLFNAMSPLAHRQPGLVGAALDHPRAAVGLIADGHHVHPAALRVALRAKPPARLTLVTDAMPTVGAPGDRFRLGGREVVRAAGRLALADGTLAGSDLDMASAVRFMVQVVGAPVTLALRMATLNPARLLGVASERGSFHPGARADMVALDSDLRPIRVWIGGRALDGD